MADQRNGKLATKMPDIDLGTEEHQWMREDTPLARKLPGVYNAVRDLGRELGIVAAEQVLQVLAHALQPSLTTQGWFGKKGTVVRPDIEAYAKQLGGMRPEVKVELSQIFDQVSPKFLEGVKTLIRLGVEQDPTWLLAGGGWENGIFKQLEKLAHTTKDRLTSTTHSRLTRLIRGLIERQHYRQVAGIESDPNQI